MLQDESALDWHWYHTSALLALCLMVWSLITSWKVFQVFNPDLGLWTYTKCGPAFVLPHRHDLDGVISALVVPIHGLMSHRPQIKGTNELPLGIKCVKNSQAMFVRPASTHPFNSKLEAQFNTLVRFLGVKCWMEGISLLPTAQPMHRRQSAISHTLPQTKGWLNLFLGVHKKGN